MKKTTIGVLIVAGIMIVAGIGLCIGGVMAAGGVESAKNALYESGVDLSHVMEIDEDGFDIDFDRGNHLKIHHEEYAYGDGQFAYAVEDVKSLELEIGGAYVEILESGSAKDIVVQTDGKFEVSEKNGVLYVKSGKHLEKNTIVLEIPKNKTFKTVDIEVGAGMVFIENLEADHVEFEIGAGEIIVNNGNVQECDINVDAGNFEYTGKILKHGDVECGMGNAEFYLDGVEEDYNYEIDCTAGNVGIGEMSFSGVSVEKHINNQANAAIEIDCDLGNVTVEF